MMRLTVGITAIIQGIAYLSDYRNAPLSTLAIALFAVLCGALLVIGLMTPIATPAVVFGIIATAVSIVPAAIYNLLETFSSAVFARVLAAALALLGPGALSLDALMFGRREIVIPGKSNTPEP